MGTGSEAMSIDERELAGAGVAEEGGETPEPRKLSIELETTETGPCRRHLKISISRADIEQEFDSSLSQFASDAFMPGFRPGKAPKHLVQKRYRAELSDRVKANLIMAGLEQLERENLLNPIAQPDLDMNAVKLPDDGPLVFELDIEVAPEFEAPTYKGLKLKVPAREIGQSDVDEQIESYRRSKGTLVPKDGAVERGDHVVAKLTVKIKGLDPIDLGEREFEALGTLRLLDGVAEKVAETLAGAKVGETRSVPFTVGEQAAEESARGKSGTLEVEIVDLKTIRPAEVEEILKETGHSNLGELRDTVFEGLKAREEANRRQRARAAALEQLLDQVDFPLPPDLVDRRQKSTVERRVMELHHAGLSEEEIAHRSAELQMNALATATRGLRQQFVLSKIAELEDVKVQDEDILHEIDILAERYGESPRRVRAQLERNNQLESVAIMALERKAIERVVELAEVETTPAEASEKRDTDFLAAAVFGKSGSDSDSDSESEG